MANLSNAEHTKSMPLMSRLTLQASSWLTRLTRPDDDTARKRALAWILVFASYLITAEVGLYLYRGLGTSPAFIWPPVGIALAAVLLEGYWVGSAIAAAAFATGFLAEIPFFLIIGATIASTLQPLLGGFILRRFHFNTLLSTLRDVFLLIFVAVSVTVTAPIINYLFAYAYNYFAVVDIPLPAWPQLWMGGALSALVLTPFLSRWIGHDLMKRSRAQQLEFLFSVTFVSVLSYIIFATALPAFFSTTFLLLLLGAFFWIAFRLGPRVMSLALLIMTSISLAGTIYGIHAPSPTHQSLAERLVSTEIFDLILCFFFFILVSVEEQRKEAIKVLTQDAERLETALETIRAEDRAKNEFIATLAHELRNPLAPVMSGLELLRIGEKDPERIDILESAQRQSFMMRRLLDELLDVARIAQRSFVLQKKDVPLQTILKEACDSVRYFFKERGHTFTISISNDEMWIHGDSVRLTQIFSNILFNAGKYTEPGGTISLTLEKKDGRAVIRVTDTGAGISEEMLTHIFEPFVQDSGRSMAGSGLGIGLSIAKRLVELHGGSIVARSDGKNLGSIFTVELPVHTKHVTQTVLNPESGLIPSSILVVDDNRDAAKSIARLLRARGNTVDIVYNGKDALAALSKKPQYVLLDIGLPDMEGHVVAKEIRTRDPEAIIIALSGYGSKEDKRKALEAGISVHLTKPASLADIEAALTSNGIRI